MREIWQEYSMVNKRILQERAFTFKKALGEGTFPNTSLKLIRKHCSVLYAVSSTLIFPCWSDPGSIALESQCRYLSLLLHAVSSSVGLGLRRPWFLILVQVSWNSVTFGPSFSHPKLPQRIVVRIFWGTEPCIPLRSHWRQGGMKTLEKGQDKLVMNDLH